MLTGSRTLRAGSILSGAACMLCKWLSRKPVRLRQRRALPGTECLRALPW